MAGVDRASRAGLPARFNRRPPPTHFPLPRASSWLVVMGAEGGGPLLWRYDGTRWHPVLVPVGNPIIQLGQLPVRAACGTLRWRTTRQPFFFDWMLTCGYPST